MAEDNVRVGNIRHVSGEVTIAGRDIVKGYTPEQVSVLLAQITSTFQPKPFDGTCPYKGLGVFEEEDAELFFGREKLVADLIGRVEDCRAVFVTGPSGCGKSSLVRAGLIPACRNGGVKSLQSEHWLYATMRPGPKPLETLAVVLSRLKDLELAKYFREHVHETSILNACAESVLSERADQRFVLFIDQFEEFFTQINKKEEREEFLQVLTDAIAVENGRVILLFSLRSDFLSNFTDYPSLNALLNQPSAFAQIGGMQPDELVSAIAQPALRVGLRIDPDLIAQVIQDMGGEPGALPLMQFALKDLFEAEQTKGGIIALTRESYLARGGIHKSLELHADKAFNTLKPNEQELARSIFSSLIEIGRGTPDTGRTAWFDELVPASANAEVVKAIIEKLTDARLITKDELSGRDTVTISHERLIDAWPWLRRLVNENRDVIALKNEVSNDAKEWEDHQYDASYLYSGARLANALEKLDAKQLVLSGTAQAFVQAGRRRKRLNQVTLIGGIATVIVLLVIAVVIYRNQSNAFEKEARIAFTRQVAAKATVLQADKIDLAMLLSLQAYTLNPDDFETRSSLLSTLQCCSDGLIALMRGHEDSIWDVAFSPDGKQLASAGNDGTIILWDVASHQLDRRIIPTSTPPIYTLAFSPDNKYLASGDAAGWIIIYDRQNWEPVAKLRQGVRSTVLSIKFSKDGKWLVSGGTDGYVLVWDTTNFKLSKMFIGLNQKGQTSRIWDVAISPDNKTIASVGNDAKLHLWSLEPGQGDRQVSVNVLIPRSVPKSYYRFVSVAFNDNPNSEILVTGGTNGNLFIWDLKPWREEHGQPIPSNSLPTAPGATTNVWGLAFVPGHDFEIVTGRDKGIMNRNLIVLGEAISSTALQPQLLGMTGNNFGFFRIDVSPDGKYMAAAGQDGLVSLWETTEVSSVIRHPSKITGLRILDGNSSTAISVDTNGGVYRWNYRERTAPKKVSLETVEAIQSAISADGSRVVTGYSNGNIILWDAKTGAKLSEHSDHSAAIASLAFSPDGKQFASSDTKGNVILWEVTAKTLEPSDHFTDPTGLAVQTLLFSPDGKMLAGGGCRYPIAGDCSQGTTHIWDTQRTLSDQSRLLPGKAGFVKSLAFNPAADKLAVGSINGVVTIWDLREDRPSLDLRLSEGAITALAFSPDGGEFLAVGANNYSVSLFDAETGQRYGQSFREHDSAVTALAFTVDENGELSELLSASSDSTVVIHDMKLSQWIEHACRVANRNLTRAEWNLYLGDTLPYPAKQEEATCPGSPLPPELSPTATLPP